jgi:hypothetical protein
VPVLDVKDSEVSVREAAGEAHVLGIRRFELPLKVTILLDNGPKISHAMVPVRTGLQKFFDGIPKDIPVSLVTTAPAPRFLVRESMDPIQIQKAVSQITPEAEDSGAYGRFSDSLVEYSHRLEDEFRHLSLEQKPPYLPVLIVISTTTQDGSLVRKQESQQMILALRKYNVWTNFVMVTPSKDPSFGDDQDPNLLIDDAQVSSLAKAVQENTGGRYMPVSGSGVSGLSSTILPGLAKDVTIRHLKQVTQYQIAVERPAGALGQPKKLDVGINRPGVIIVQISPDGNMK